jgi:signal transduction histidine kinase
MIIRTFDHDKKLEYWQYAIEMGERIDVDPQPFIFASEILIDTKKHLLINEDFEEFAVEHGDTPTTKGLAPKSAIFVPMIVGDTVVGSVSLQNVEEEHAFTESDLQLITTLTNSMSVAIENARLFNETTRLLAETEQRATELQTVNRISYALVSQLEFDALINLVGELMKETFKADIVYVAVHNRDTDMIHFPYEYGDKSEPRKFGDGFTERIITTNKPLLINKDLEETRDLLQAKQIGKVTSSYLGVPISIGQKPTGVISVQSTEEENRFDENDQRLLTTIAANVGVAMQNAESYEKLRSALTDLKAAQEQLVQQEKLASLGQLTAGIAHEIKNPLNFVNNFSDLSIELIEEAREELRKLTIPDDNFALDIMKDIEENLKKIFEHGSRADGIVKSMLQHSRGGTGKVEPTDMNALIKEYVNLAFHGMRASKNPINVDIDLNLDENASEIPLIAEDFSRVILNLCNNAFDAMREKLQNAENRDGDKYLPRLKVVTEHNDRYLKITIEDNGPGIPTELKDKILQPFFTTKKGKEGTGLGLSITNDIVKGHGGHIDIQTEPNAFTRFLVTLPYQKTMQNG